MFTIKSKYIAVAAALIALSLNQPAFAGPACEPALVEDLFCPPGVQGENITDSIVWDDGTGPKLYIAGTFTSVECTEAMNIACWDGSNWFALGAGLGAEDFRVHALEVFDDGTGEALYAGGDFVSAGGDPTIRYLAKWDGEEWSRAGDYDVDGTVYALCANEVDGSPTLAVGGFRVAIEGNDLNYIMSWDGVEWQEIGDDINGTVFFLSTVDNGTDSALYAAGEFRLSGTPGTKDIAKWDGTSWSSIGVVEPLTSSAGINSMVVHDDGTGPDLYVAEFSAISINGEPVDGVARWDGSGWFMLPAATDQGPFLFTHGYALTSVESGEGSELYVGVPAAIHGDFEANVLQWNGSVWEVVASGPVDLPLTMSEFDAGGGNAVYVSGFFTTPWESQGIHGLRRIGESGWTSVHSDQPFGLNADVQDLQRYEVDGEEVLAVAGAFTDPDFQGRDRVSVFDGASWAALGQGFDGPANALAVVDHGDGEQLYAAGEFFASGGTPTTRVARWNGSEWNAVSGPMGEGASNTVNAAIGFDDGSGEALYIGGRFINAGGVVARRVARWDGVEWSGLPGQDGSGLSGEARAFAVFDDGTGPALYVGGSFADAGGQTVNRIARWDGAEWSALEGPDGIGVNSTVFALCVHDDGTGPALFAAGSFSEAGGNPASRIAKWDGSEWSAVSPFMVNAPVLALASVVEDGGRVLYLGGQFTQLGSQPVGRIAKLGPDGLVAADLSFNSPVLSLELVEAEDRNSLFVGGGFTSVTSPEGVFAKWRIAEWEGCVEDQCPADVTGDGSVDLADLNLVLAGFGQSTPDGDATGDGIVDLADLNAVLAPFGTDCR